MKNSEILGFRFGLEWYQNDQTQNPPQKRIVFPPPVQDQQLGVSHGRWCCLLVDSPRELFLRIAQRKAEQRKEELSEVEAQERGFLKRITLPNNKKILLNQNSSISATESLLQMQPECETQELQLLPTHPPPEHPPPDLNEFKLGMQFKPNIISWYLFHFQ